MLSSCLKNSLRRTERLDCRINPKGATASLRFHNRPMRFFSTEEPVRPHMHYAIPPLERIDVGDLYLPMTKQKVD